MEACFHPASVLALFWLCSPRLAKRSMLLCRMQMMGWFVFWFFMAFPTNWFGDQKWVPPWLETLRIFIMFDMFEIFVRWVFFVQSRISWKTSPQRPRAKDTFFTTSTTWGVTFGPGRKLLPDQWRYQKICQDIHLLIMNISKAYNTKYVAVHLKQNMKTPMFILKSFF